MKVLILSICLALMLPVTAMAAPDIDDSEIYALDPIEDVGGSGGSGGLTEEDVLLLLSDLEDNEVKSLYTVAELNEYDIEPAADAEDQTMRDVIVLVLGEYTPRTQTVTEFLSDGSSETYVEVVPGLAGLDWEWIAGAGLFALALLSFFRIVGVFLKNG